MQMLKYLQNWGERLFEKLVPVYLNATVILSLSIFQILFGTLNIVHLAAVPILQQ